MTARISSNRLPLPDREPDARRVGRTLETGRQQGPDPADVARAQDALRKQIGPVGAPVGELIDEGRD